MCTFLLIRGENVMWITPETVTIPTELSNAIYANRRRLRKERYRSRTDVTDEHINEAFSWLRLKRITVNEAGDIALGELNNSHALYKTTPVPRGVSEDEALNICLNTITEISTNYNWLNIVTFNTSTAAAGSEKLREWLDTQEAYRKLDIDAIVKTTVNHKIFIYHNRIDGKDNYIILNNLDTPTVIFKIAAAIMLDMNYFTDNTQQFAEAWMNGNGNDICNLIQGYYEAFRANEALHKRKEAIEAVCKSMITDKSNSFKRRMSDIEDTIDRLFNDIATYNKQLNDIKGEYLLYTLTDDSAKANELRKFFETCDNKLSYINFNDSYLYIAYRTKLMYFEPELLKRYFESTRSNCINSAPKNKQQLIKDIFINNKYDLLIESGARLNLSENRIAYAEPLNFNNYDATTMQGIPNPHHRYYNCWGDNGPNITRALMEKDYITALTVTFAAMSGLNIADTAVMEKFVREELENYTRINCLQNKETGEIITIQEYYRRWTENASNEANE